LPRLELWKLSRKPANSRRSFSTATRKAIWGELDSHDVRENEISLQSGFRLLSSYTTAAGDRLWIITEADRSATTLLLPEEY
jgi:hypothetical protein